jgi:dTDP-4-dehydrorhamnose reductase
MLGHQVVRRFARDWDVHATVRDPARAEALRPAATLHAFDAHRPELLAPLLGVLLPDVVVNCIGIVKQLEEASRPLPAITLNALFPHQLAEACTDTGSRLFHVSTDCVFSGTLPPGDLYTEDSVSDAHDLYGRTKFLGEVADGRALTLRTSIIGWELTRPTTGLVEWFAAQKGREVSGFTKAIFSGVTTATLANVIAQVAEEHPHLEGVYHVSAEPIDKFTLLSLVRDRLGLDVEIRPVDEPVVNRALDSSRFRAATGIEIPSWHTMIDELAPTRVVA